MKYKLVIAEKPSVAMSLSKVLGATERKDGYMEGGGWLVSWCIGHLARLADAETYDPRYARWRRDDLPILPNHWQYLIGPDKKCQFDILKGLMNRNDVSEVVNACDAGREGEAIFRTVYHLAGCDKSILRLWISSMEDAAIRKGFDCLRPGTDYDGLYNAALCRSKADWLVGINATRLFSVLYGRTLNIGRVMSPTLALIVQRESEIAAFTPTPYYTVELDCGGMTVAGEHIPDKKEAQDVAAACKGQSVTIQAVTHKERSEKAPALFDLTSLQREANRALGYTAQQTLDYLQALYEKRLCTYPRTDSRFLTEDMESSVPGLVSAAATVCDLDIPETVLAGQICDGERVTDHHAIIPTESAASMDVSALPLGERKVLHLVSLGLLRAVCPPCRYAETSLEAECGGHVFTAKVKDMLAPGWRTYTEKESSPGTHLPDGLADGQELVVVDARVKEGKTSPPKHFTEDTLLQSMETAGASEMPEDTERRGIGTPATRAGIIEKLVSVGFVERKKAKKATNLLPTQCGNALITVLPEALQSPLLTAEWEHRLREVERGLFTPEDFMTGIAVLVSDLVSTYEPITGWEILFPSDKEIVGKCPRCGRNVTEGKKGFFCEAPSCRFALWKDSHFFSAKKKQLTKAIVSALLTKGKAKLTGCYSEKTGKTYDAVVVLEDDGAKTAYKMEFLKGGRGNGHGK